MKKILFVFVLVFLTFSLFAATLNDVQSLSNKGKYKEAQTACNEILAQKPGNINVLRWLAYVDYKLGEFDSVINMNNDVKDAEIAYSKGLCYLGKNDLVNAEKEFSNAILFDKKLVGPYVSKAKIHIDNKDYANAKSYLVMANKIAPNDINILNNLGYVNIQLGEFDNAINNLLKAKNIKSNDENVLLNLSNAYFSKKDYKNALKEYNKLYNINSKNSDCINGLAITNAKLNNIDAAIKYYNMLLKTVNTSDVNYNLGILLKKKNDFKGALVYLSKASELNNSDKNALTELGWCQYKTNKIKESIETLNKVLSIDPDNIVANAYLGTINSNTNKLQDAYSNWSKCVLLAQKNTDFKINLGNTCISLGKYDEAINAFKNALLLNNNLTQANLGLGIAQVSKANTGVKDKKILVSNAINNFNVVLKKEPKNSVAWVNLGVCHQLNKKYNDAMNCYKKALIINPKSSEAKANMDELGKVMK